MFCMFFFSSRRRHTRCALVTGVQTCALPIYRRREKQVAYNEANGITPTTIKRNIADVVAHVASGDYVTPEIDDRSEERRVGKECVSTCRSRWSPYHYKNKITSKE